MGVNSESVVVFITASSDEEAGRIAGVLVEKRAAACVNTLSAVRSLYWWQGNMDSAQETLLIVKTRSSLLSRVIELVKQNHSYTVPEVIAMPIAGGNPDYLKWLSDETANPAGTE